PHLQTKTCARYRAADCPPGSAAKIVRFPKNGPCRPLFSTGRQQFIQNSCIVASNDLHAEVRAANERLHPQGRVKVVISREDAEDRVNRRYVVDMA
ncbi:hypothetical protein ACYCI6_16610, partial [Klebsiella pneumoniae]